MKSVKYFVVTLVCVSLTYCSAIHLTSSNASISCKSPRFTNETALDMAPDDSDDFLALSLRKALASAVLSDDASFNHYSESIGHIRLLNAISTLYSPLINKTLNPRENIIATVGATEALAIAFQSLTQPGDEWIVIEPFWIKFRPQIEIFHGIPRYSNLKLNKKSGDIRGSNWQLDKAEIASLINNKTRGIVLNNPNNPAGKVYTRRELQFIADLAEKWNVIVIADESYEWAVYKPQKMIKFASLPGMFNRTVTIGSASKSFIATGWRIGWAYGPAHLIEPMASLHFNFIQSAPTPQQIAVAYALEQEYKNYGKPYSFFKKNVKSVVKKRDFIARALREAGMIPIVPDGGYCTMATWPQLKKHPNIREDFANWMTKNIGVRGFSLTRYYGDEHRPIGQKYIRFCFHKRNETLQLAAHNFMRLRDFED